METPIVCKNCGTALPYNTRSGLCRSCRKAKQRAAVAEAGSKPGTPEQTANGSNEELGYTIGIFFLILGLLPLVGGFVYVHDLFSEFREADIAR